MFSTSQYQFLPCLYILQLLSNTLFLQYSTTSAVSIFRFLLILSIPIAVVWILSILSSNIFLSSILSFSQLPFLLPFNIAIMSLIRRSHNSISRRLLSVPALVCSGCAACSTHFLTASASNTSAFKVCELLYKRLFSFFQPAGEGGSPKSEVIPPNAFRRARLSSASGRTARTRA